MSTRLAEFADLTECLRMGREFTRAAGLTADDDSLAATLTKLLEDGSLYVSGSPIVGMAAVLVYPNYFNLATNAAQELFWWVDPDARKSGVGYALLQALEGHARDNGAKTLTMVALDALDAERVAGMYMNCGYKPLERSFVRHL